MFLFSDLVAFERHETNVNDIIAMISVHLNMNISLYLFKKSGLFFSNNMGYTLPGQLINEEQYDNTHMDIIQFLFDLDERKDKNV